jgi:polar amino acid transport system substrate-binding protein
LSALAEPAWAAPPTIKICDDNSFASFFYSDANGEHGATAEFLSILFTNLHLRYRVDIMPWARCQAYIREGSYDMAIDTAFDPHRLRDYRYTLSYYRLTPQYFYLQSRFPAGLKVNSHQDLKHYQGCGLHGFSYAYFKMQARDLETGSADYAEVIRKTRMGLCDYFLAEQEVIQGDTRSGPAHLDIHGLGHGPVPDASSDQLYFFLSKSSAVTPWLLPLLNQQIMRANQVGTMRMLVKHPQPSAR